MGPLTTVLFLCGMAVVGSVVGVVLVLWVAESEAKKAPKKPQSVDRLNSGGEVASEAEVEATGKAEQKAEPKVYRTTLKEELDKLIEEERAKLDEAASTQDNQHEALERHIRPLAQAVLEIVRAADPAFVKWREATFGFVVELGQLENDSFDVGTRLEIGPNSEFRMVGERPVMFDLPGFEVEETTYITYPSCDLVETKKSFQTERDVCEHVMTLLAKHIARQSRR